jgi:hypothetical protein
MKSRYVSVVAVLAAMLLFSLSTFAQQQAKNNWTAASFDGTAGLFKTWDAETLKPYESSYSFGYDLFHREPGQLTIGRVPVGVAFGAMNRLEVFASMDVQKHIVADNIAFYRRAPDQLPIPATTPLGSRYFSQAAPFIDVPSATGRGDVHLGVKYNILSEGRDDSFSLGLAGFGTLPGQKSRTGVSRGLSAGAYQGGFAMLLSKTVADYARLHLNYGANFASNPEDGSVELANLSHEFIYRAGVELSAYKAVHVISEVNGIKYFGSRTIGLNPKSPIDLILGLRVYPREWLTLGGGYQVSLRKVHDIAGSSPLGILRSAFNGFVVQGTVAMTKATK